MSRRKKAIDVFSTVAEGLKHPFPKSYAVWWALVLGFAISAIVQAWAASVDPGAAGAHGGV